MILESSLVKGKKPRRVTEELREKVLGILSRELTREKRIVVALVFGSFIKRSYARDVDVAVYLRDPSDLLDDYGYAEELGKRLSSIIGFPVDIVILNHVGDMVFNEALIEGKPVLIRDWRLYIGLRMLAFDQRRFFRKISKEVKH